MNWLRPRFRWTGAGDETIGEVRKSAASQTNDFRVETRSTEWFMPQEQWKAVATGVEDMITVRGQGPGGLVGMRGVLPVETKSSHLYVSVIEHDPETGTIVSYAPIYLWNQNFLATGPDTYEVLETANLTPAWEDFSIPQVPPVTVVR